MIQPLETIEHVDIHPGIQGPNFFHPSCLVRGGELVVSMRAGEPSPPPLSYTVLGRLDDRWRPTGIRRARLETGDELFEDARLFELPDGRLAVVATMGTLPNYHLSIAVFDDKGDVADVWPLPLALRMKNWSPVLDGSGRFLYAPLGPVLHVDVPGRRVAPRPPTYEVTDRMFRGGSQLIPFNGGFLTAVHEQRRIPDVDVHYTHRFIYYSSELHVERVSEPFYLERIGVEYVTGLALWRDRLVMTYGIEDHSCRLVTVDPTVAEAMLKPWHKPSRCLERASRPRHRSHIMRAT